jgi:hypothetical protein
MTVHQMDKLKLGVSAAKIFVVFPKQITLLPKNIKGE